MARLSKGPGRRLILVAMLVTGSLSVFLPATALIAQEDKFSAAIRSGEAALKLHNYEDAVTAFKQANALQNKTSVEAFLGLSRAYIGLEAFKSAVQSCDDAMKVAGGDKRLEAAIHNQKGMALAAWADKPGDPKLKAAEVEFRAVIESGDTFVLAPYNLGVTLLKLNRDPEGVEQLKAYLARGPKTPEAAEARRMIENPRRAREAYAPDFSLVTMEGEHIALADLAGKTVLLDFWGTWCPPCRAATPNLVELYKQFSKRENFVMIGVAVGEEDETKWRDYIAQNKMTWLEYIDKTHKVAAAFNIHSFPTYVVINGEGIVQGTKQGWGGSPTITWIADTVLKTLKAGAGAK